MALSEILSGQECPYCHRQTELVDRRVLCGPGAAPGLIYACRRCEAWVGVHKASKKSLGRLANKELRFWKMEAHSWFDVIWKQKVRQGERLHDARTQSYKWLARTMKIDPKYCHIGMFDVSQCKRAVQICKLYIRKHKKR